MRTQIAALAAIVMLTFGNATAWALFETNKTLSESATISMEQALSAARQAVQGKPVEVNMGKDEGRVVYKIEIVDANKKTHYVYVDAQNGKIVETKGSVLK
ncbi:MAG: PepSY domain-containing protein [Nitrospirae bacterium]|nr:MAG: PepSY domain-containing protein [Nitrospirota bacterium]